MKPLLLLLFLVFELALKAQYLQNASFEGVAKVGLPEEWLAYGKASSPDTQPGIWNISANASHGNSYITMVCRGYSIIDNYLWEACYQKFQQPLISNKTYHYSLDLAFAPEFLADTVHFNRPIQLKIYGMNASFEKELLWESGSVEHTFWKTYDVELKPNTQADYLLLEAYYVDFPKYNGNIMMDNLVYYPNGFPTKKNNELIVNDTTIIENPYDLTVATDGKINSVNGRKVKNRNVLQFNSNELTFTVFDNQAFDGDIISLFMNDKCILSNYLLTKNKHTFTLKVNTNKQNQLILYAHNVGKIPPNTVTLLIDDGTISKKVVLSSNLTNCSALSIVIN